MAQSPRQSKLFAAEDYQNIYRSFKNVDFRAYDFESIKASLAEYIKRNYPEDFNDYIESSEFIAIIELLAYVGTSLSFRSDLNTRENLLDTADRRESVVRLAQMLNYQPSRNLPARGLFKLTGVETTESVQDSMGRNLANTTIFWNDPNNQDSYDQFTNIINASLLPSSPFGKPVKRGTVDGVNTDLYRLENVKDLLVAYPVQVTVNGEQIPFDITNLDFEDEGTFFERHPDPNSGFHIAYRNDGQGFASPNTGFFVHFRQGELNNYDFAYQFPEESRVEEISANDINERDVYVQEISDDGTVIQKWTKVDYSRGNENVVYNSIDNNERSIYSVLSGANDTISIQYPDGNFGEVPTGIMRVWARTSANRNLVVRPDEAKDIEITIPYIGTNKQTYFLRLIFGLEETSTNSAPSETNDEVKIRAPQVYYTQDRMVNNKDYNVFPLTRGNEILKLRTINRTHSGDSRYIPLNDPTGFHQSLLINAADGAFYRDNQKPSSEIGYNPATDTASFITSTGVETLLQNRELENFFYDEYITDFKKFMSERFIQGTDTYVQDNVFLQTAPANWSTKNGSAIDNIGSFINPSNNNVYIINKKFSLRVQGEFKYIDAGSFVKFAKENNSKEYSTAKVLSISEGEIVFDNNVTNGWVVVEVLPPFRTTFNDNERQNINRQIEDSAANFGLEYIIDNAIDGSVADSLGWKTTPNSVFDFSITNGDKLNRWLLRATYQANNLTDLRYKLETRGSRYIFESESDVRFFYDSENQKNFSSDQLVSGIDEIIISGANNEIGTTEKWVKTNNQTGGRWRLSDGTNAGITYPAEFIVLGSRTASSGNVEASITKPNGDVFDVSSNVVDGVLYLSSFSAFDTVNNAGNQINSVPAGSTLNITTFNNSARLEKDFVLNTFKPYFEPSGYLNTAKIEVVAADVNNDGIPDDPFLFTSVVGENDLVFNENVIDANGEDYTRIWSTIWKDLRKDKPNDDQIIDTISNDDIINAGLFLTLSENYEQTLKSLDYSLLLFLIKGGEIDEKLSDNYQTIVYREDRDPDTDKIITTPTDIFSPMIKVNVNADGLRDLKAYALDNKTNDDAEAIRLTLSYIDANTQNRVFRGTPDNTHQVYNGRSFTLNKDDPNKQPFEYKWRHFSPASNRIDPSTSNIMDMVLLTQNYNDEVLKWKVDGLPVKDFPVPPSTDELKANFNELDDFKMMSDEIIFGSSSFKIIFGQQAKPELRAKFKVIKVPSTTLTNNEVKSRVVELIDEYFSVDNWDFGETFYFTELAAFIHKNTAGIVGSVILVPESLESQFGNLFQVNTTPNELFISTAQVSDIIIVDTLTENNMRL